MKSSRPDAKPLQENDLGRVAEHQLTSKVKELVQRQGLAKALGTSATSDLESFYLIALSWLVPDGSEIAQARNAAALRLARRKDKQTGTEVRAATGRKGSS